MKQIMNKQMLIDEINSMLERKKRPPMPQEVKDKYTELEVSIDIDESYLDGLEISKAELLKTMAILNYTIIGMTVEDKDLKLLGAIHLLLAMWHTELDISMMTEEVEA